MPRLKKRQAFICILISLLVYGMMWGGLLLSFGEPNQIKAFSFGSSKESPLWQANQSNLAFLQSVTVISSNRLSIKNSGNVLGALYSHHHSINSSHAVISLRIIDIPNTVFKFISGQTYQDLDIPPPHNLASL